MLGEHTASPRGGNGETLLLVIYVLDSNMES